METFVEKAQWMAKKEIVGYSGRKPKKGKRTRVEGTSSMERDCNGGKNFLSNMPVEEEGLFVYLGGIS